MLGILLSLVAAVFKGSRDVVSKRALKKAPVFAVLGLSTFFAFLMYNILCDSCVIFAYGVCWTVILYEGNKGFRNISRCTTHCV